jgi:hypothetical protein
MNDPSLAAAAYWAPLLETVGDIAFLIVIIALAVELGAGRFAKHFHAQLDGARELQIATLENGTERLKADNLRLMTTLQPRRIAMGNLTKEPGERGDRFRKVAEFSGTRALVQAVPDFEAQILASDIVFALRNCGWNAESMTDAQSRVPPGFIMEGVRITTLETSPFQTDGSVKMPQFSRASEAGRAVADLLQLDLGPPRGPAFFSSFWGPEYEGLGAMLGGFPLEPGVVLVLVGMRPTMGLLNPSPSQQAAPANTNK